MADDEEMQFEGDEDAPITQARRASPTARSGVGKLTAAAPGGRAAAQEDSWQVISSYFEAKGLVRQQLVRGARPHVAVPVGTRPGAGTR